MLIVMSEDGGFAASVAQQVLESAFVKNMKTAAQTSVGQFKERIKNRISRATGKTGASKALMTKKVILSNVNPRAQTSGVDAQDVTR